MPRSVSLVMGKSKIKICFGVLTPENNSRVGLVSTQIQLLVYFRSRVINSSSVLGRKSESHPPFRMSFQLIGGGMPAQIMFDGTFRNYSL